MTSANDVTVESPSNDQDETILCTSCMKDITEDCCFTSDDKWFCYDCFLKILEEHKQDIMEYANQVRITGEVEVFDPAYRFAPTPEEYEYGDRTAYTANSVRAFNRHHRTNYDLLIRELRKYDDLDNEYYSAVRDRVEDLLNEAEDDKELIKDDTADKEICQ